MFNSLADVISLLPTAKGLPKLHIQIFLNGVSPLAIFYLILERSKLTI